MINNHKAFTLLEVVVVVFLIGIIASIFIPRLFKRSPTAEWSSITEDLNSLALFARQEALANHFVYRLTFIANPKGTDSVRVEQEKDDPEKPGHKKYDLVSSYYLPTTYNFNTAIRLKAVYVGKTNMLDEQQGVAHCYIIPDGLVQDVIVHLVRRLNGVETSGSFIMNPFFGRFEFNEGLIRPAR